MKNYTKPEIKIDNITADDIIMTSLNGNTAENYGTKSYDDLF